MSVGSAGGTGPKAGLVPIEWGDNALSAPTTPQKRLPVVDRNKADPQVRAAAEGMEAMFLDYLMKTMRQTVPKSDMDLESPATEIYRSMQDSDSAQRAAKAGGVGLADQIIAYLEIERYTQGKPGQAAQPAQNRGVSKHEAIPSSSRSDSMTSQGLAGGTDEGHR